MKFEVEIDDSKLDDPIIGCGANLDVRIWTIRELLILLKEKGTESEQKATPRYVGNKGYKGTESEEDEEP